MKIEFRNPITALILTFVTCGIYGLYWFYKLNEEIALYLNVDANELSAAKETVFSIICFPYNIYWGYKIGPYVQTIAERSGQRSENQQMLFLLLGVIGLSIINMLIIQETLNKANNQVRSS